MAEAEIVAKTIRLVVLDVDGVLTDGGLYFGDDGMAFKRFHVQDGLGIKVGQKHGLTFAVITGLDHKSTAARIEALGIEHYHAGYSEKLPKVREICEQEGIDLSQVAYVGDDLVDAEAMLHVGLPVAVANAVLPIREVAKLITTKSGGHGAVREVVDYLLAAQGKLEAVWAEWTGGTRQADNGPADESKEAVSPPKDEIPLREPESGERAELGPEDVAEDAAEASVKDAQTEGTSDAQTADAAKSHTEPAQKTSQSISQHTSQHTTEQSEPQEKQ